MMHTYLVFWPDLSAEESAAPYSAQLDLLFHLLQAVAQVGLLSAHSLALSKLSITFLRPLSKYSEVLKKVLEK